MGYMYYSLLMLVIISIICGMDYEDNMLYIRIYSVGYYMGQLLWFIKVIQITNWLYRLQIIGVKCYNVTNLWLQRLTIICVREYDDMYRVVCNMVDKCRGYKCQGIISDMDY